MKNLNLLGGICLFACRLSLGLARWMPKEYNDKDFNYLHQALAAADREAGRINDFNTIMLESGEDKDPFSRLLFDHQHSGIFAGDSEEELNSSDQQVFPPKVMQKRVRRATLRRTKRVKRKNNGGGQL